MNLSKRYRNSRYSVWGFIEFIFCCSIRYFVKLFLPWNWFYWGIGEILVIELLGITIWLEGCLAGSSALKNFISFALFGDIALDVGTPNTLGWFPGLSFTLNVGVWNSFIAVDPYILWSLFSSMDISSHKLIESILSFKFFLKQVQRIFFIYSFWIFFIFPLVKLFAIYEYVRVLSGVSPTSNSYKIIPIAHMSLLWV